MKRVLLSLAVTALMAASVQAAPSLGFWDEGDFGTTHQFWDFHNGYVQGPAGGAYTALAEPPVINPSGVASMKILAPAVWDFPQTGADTFSGPVISLIEITIPNFGPNTRKEIWVDLGLRNGTVVGSSVDPAGDGPLAGPGPGTGADFGWVIYPNPPSETLTITILPTPGAAAVLDYVHIDTICVPAPGAMLLGGIGVGLIGWLRRYRTL